MNDTVTIVPGIKVGHAQYAEARTGCTAVILDNACSVGVDVRGGNPCTYNVECLQGTTIAESADAVFFSGGSLFGLDVAKGIRDYLVEHGIGWDSGYGLLPNVTGAVIYDLAVAQRGVRPDAKLGYDAAANATADTVMEGNFGAGTGATVGKMLGMERCMKGGLGSSGVGLDNDLCVGALVVVNALGNVFDPNTGKTIAGTRKKEGRGFVEAAELPADISYRLRRDSENTTLGLVATNAKLNRKQATKMAEMAHDGIARAIRPAHSTLDGDSIFAVSTGKLDRFSFDFVAHLATEQLATAILRAVKKARTLESIPGLGDRHT